MEYGELQEDIEGSPDEVIRALLVSLNRVYPSLEIAEQLVYQPDLAKLADVLVSVVEFAPEGLLILAEEIPSDQAIITILTGAYVGYRLGKISRDTSSTRNLAKISGKAWKTISNQLAQMVDAGLVERVGRSEYRITSLGIKRFEKLKIGG